MADMPFFQDLARHGDAPALVFPGGRVISYRELSERVTRQAQRLGEAKALVAMEARLSEHAIVAYLAALAGGHAIAMLPPDGALAAERFAADFGPDIRIRLRDGRWRLEHGDGLARGGLHPDLAVLLSTSGSTGQSRFVRLSADNVAANAASIADYLDLTAADRGLLALPLHYSYGLSVLNSHLAVGASLLVQEKSILDPGFVADLRTGRCTNMAGVPYSFELLESIGFRDHDLPDLRFMTVAGGRLAPDMVRRYHAHLNARGKRFFVMYGQTEATARMAYLPPDHLPGAADRIGIAIPGGSLSLVDEAGRPVEGSDTAGELVYRGRNVMMGYATARADLVRPAEVAALHTGDLAERNAEGLYRIVGRLRRMSKIAGLRIGHDSLEQALAERGIRAAVVGDDSTIVAVYTSGQPEAEVRRLLVERSGVPSSHVRAEAAAELPRLSSGKVDYERLKQALSAPSHAAPGGEDVETLFRQTFFPQNVGGDDTFVTLGGDSLRYVQLSVGLERALGHIPEGWERMPLRRLAQLTRRQDDRRAVGSDLLIRTFAVLLVVMHHATWWPIPGGAAAMMMLVGYSLARFQSEALFAGRFGRALRPVASVLAPYYVIVAGFAIAWQQVPWASVFLVGNFNFTYPEDHTMLPMLYWFVEAFVQLNLVWVAVLLLPAVRRYARGSPFHFGLALLAAAVALRFAVPEVWVMDWRQIFTLHWNLYLAAFGWCAVFADSTRRKLLLLGLAVAIMPLMAYFGGNWIGGWVKFMLQIPCLAILLFAPRVRIAPGAFRLVMPFAVAGYHIYLFHGFAPDILRAAFGADSTGPLFTAAVVMSGVALGLAAHRVQEVLLRTLARGKVTSAPTPARQAS